MLHYGTETVVTRPISSNGGEVLILHLLEIESFAILILFNWSSEQIRKATAQENRIVTQTFYYVRAEKHLGAEAPCRYLRETTGNRELCREQKADLKNWGCQRFPPAPLCATTRLTGHVDVLTKQGLLFRVPRPWRGTHGPKRDISLFAGAHFSKVMARKIWKSLRGGGGGHKAIMHSWL